MTDKDVDNEGIASLEPRLVAEKKPAPKPVDRSLQAEDSGHMDERAVRESKGEPDRPTTAYRIQDSRVPYSSGADLEEGGRISFRLEGEPEQGEQGAVLAASYVVERLNADGGRWEGIEATARDARKERGVDVISRGPGGRKLEMQVTRAERGLWKQLHAEGVVEGSVSTDEAAEALWLAADDKRIAADPDVFLVLDAANVGQFAFEQVVLRFRELRGMSAATMGFAQVWLAGPTAEMTFRLDTPGK